VSKDMLVILGLTASTVVVTGLFGALLLQAIRRRSLLLSIVVAALVPVAAVSAAVALNVNRMVISEHDSTVVSVALGFSTLLAVALSYVLGRRVATGSRELAYALRGLADSPFAGSSAPALAGNGRSSAPAEIAALATELDATRQSLVLSRDREQALEQSRRELVAFMSHDLRTPLAGLRALAEGLEDGVIEDQNAALSQMRVTVERLNGLVGDLFELSRLNALPARQTQARGPLSLVELADDVVGEAREHARRRQVELVLDVADDADRLAVPSRISSATPSAIPTHTGGSRSARGGDPMAGRGSPSPTSVEESRTTTWPGSSRSAGEANRNGAQKTPEQVLGLPLPGE